VTATTEHTLRVLAHVGRADLPVHAGAAGALSRRPVPPDDRVLPPLSLPGPPSGPPARSAAHPPAAEWLAAELASRPATVVATGPVTNLAAALALEPGIAEVVEEMVVLGGCEHVPSVTPLAERNVWSDPAALATVLAAGFRRLVLVTLDATSRARLDARDADAFDALGTPAGRATAGFVRERIGQYAGAPGHQEAPVHDPLAVAYLVDPGVVRLEPLHVDVDLAAGASYGRTRFDAEGEPNALVARDADRGRFVDLLLRTFSG
jgi:inosine-uridine nucleoside N-ribohydrolase